MPVFKLLTYLRDGRPRSGVAIGEHAYDAAELLKGRDLVAPDTTLGLLEEWDKVLPLLDRVAADPPASLARIPLAEVTLKAPILFPGAFFCAAANYYSHSREMNPNRVVTREGKQPYFFLKPARHTTIGPNELIRLPSVSRKVDWEIELAAVIGRRATGLTIENALSCVAGYTIVNDLSARDLAKRDDWQFVSDWFGQKVFETSMPMGPWIVPAAAIPDPQNVTLKLWVNGELQQNAMTSDMLFSLAEQIEYVSRRLELRPGDVIATGTPAGVGAPRGLFLKSNDIVRMEIGGIGAMENRVA